MNAGYHSFISRGGACRNWRRISGLAMAERGKASRLLNCRGADPHCIRHSSDVSVLPIFRPCIRRLWRSIHRACGPVGMAC